MLSRDLTGNEDSDESGSASPVVVGVDGTLRAIQAARRAAAVADKFTAPLCLVHADPYLAHGISAAPGTVRAIERAEHRASSEAILQAAQHAVLADVRAADLNTMQVRYPVNEALRDLSAGAHLIVLGCDDVPPATALLVGSTTVAVTRTRPARWSHGAPNR